MPPGGPQTLDADRLRRHQRHSEKSHHHQQHTTAMAHISMLETASMAGDGATTDDDDAVSLAYLSVAQNSPSDVSSINNYYPSTDDQFNAEYYDSENHRAKHASSTHNRQSKRLSLSSLRYTGAHFDGGTGGDGVNMFAREHLGLLVNFVAVGAVHGIFQTFAYPFLKIYLNMDEYQAYSAERWIALPWMFKVVLAFVSETVSISLGKKHQQQQQHHRCKLYLLLGWIWCLLFALIIVLLPSEKPYFDGSSGQVVNENAASAGGKYVWLLTLATIGYVLVDAVCDGLMVQLASSGGIPGGRDRNNNNQLVVVTTLQATKCGAQMVSTFVLVLLCNSDAYGGSFAWSPSIRGVFLLVAFVCVGAIACTWFFVDVQEEEELEHDQDELAQDDDDQDDEEDHKRGLLAALLTTTRALWRFLHQRDVLRAIVFTFVTRVGFSYYASASSKAVYEFYLDVSPLSSNLFSVINVSIYGAVAIGFRNSLLLQTLSWRRIMMVAAGSSIFTTLVATLFTVFNVVRSPFLTLAFEQLTSGFEALAYYVVLFYVVQIVCCYTSTSYTPDTTAPAPIEAMTRAYTTTTRTGLESSKYNLVLAVGNLGVPFAVSLSQSVGAHFDAFDDEYTQDTSHARAQVMYCILVAFVVKLASLAVLPLLPLRGSCLLATQITTSTTSNLKLQQGQVAGGGDGLRKKASALVVGGVTGFLLFWATFMVLLASFETTACLTIAGGEGC